MENSILIARLKGIIIPNIIAVTGLALQNHFKVDDGTLVFSEFVIIPILIGFMSAWFWRNITTDTSTLFTSPILTTLVALAFSALILKEGVICLIIVSPILYVFITLGLSLGRLAFRKNKKTLNISFVSLLLLIFAVDSVSEHRYENMVADTLVINAPPEKVWSHVVSFEKIKQPNHYWLFQIGMPSPSETTVTGNYEGAGRKCIFSNGYTFDEVISTYEPNKNLTFDIVGQPRDPEIMGHIDILRGQFLLTDNHDGTTTLTGNSWYRLYVFPAWYYDIWSRSVTRNVHFRVMEHIKELSEK